MIKKIIQQISQKCIHFYKMSLFIKKHNKFKECASNGVLFDQRGRQVNDENFVLEQRMSQSKFTEFLYKLRF